METKIRPLPLTIVDILAVILPGFVWLVLLRMATDFFPPQIQPPGIARAIDGLKQYFSQANQFVGTVLLAASCLAIGWVVKNCATRLTEQLTRWLACLSPNTRGLSPAEMLFPYTAHFSTGKPFRDVKQAIEKLTENSCDDLPGKQPFTLAKRYLRLAAPPLWEECERMEAEVRMFGAFFLAALFHTAMTFLIFLKVQQGRYAEIGGIPAWFQLLLSIGAVLYFGVAFNTRRLKEVGYAYSLLLLALGYEKATANKRKESEPADGE